MQRQYTPAERAAAFWAKVDRNGPVPAHRPDLGPCWLWTASANNMGYGKFWQRENGSRLMLAHVWAYEQSWGLVPPGLELDHLCRTPLCVNHGHLEAVTRKVNNHRGISPAAVNARKTHCLQGHPFAGANLKLESDGRRCLTCRRERDRQRRPSRKLLAARAV